MGIFPANGSSATRFFHYTTIRTVNNGLLHVWLEVGRIFVDTVRSLASPNGCRCCSKFEVEVPGHLSLGKIFRYVE